MLGNKSKAKVEEKDDQHEDKSEVAATYHRHVVNPGDDVTNEDPRVAAIAAATWTEEVVAAYEASKAPVASEQE